jgi:hypothetical protein
VQVSLSARDCLLQTDTVLTDIVMALPRATRLEFVLTNKLVSVDRWNAVVDDAKGRFSDGPFILHDISPIGAPWRYHWYMVPGAYYLNTDISRWEIEFALHDLIDW